MSIRKIWLLKIRKRMHSAYNILFFKYEGIIKEKKRIKKYIRDNQKQNVYICVRSKNKNMSFCIIIIINLINVQTMCIYIYAECIFEIKIMKKVYISYIISYTYIRCCMLLLLLLFFNFHSKLTDNCINSFFLISHYCS